MVKHCLNPGHSTGHPTKSNHQSRNRARVTGAKRRQARSGEPQATRHPSSHHQSSGKQMTTKAELIDLDHYCELMDQSVMIEIVQDGELNLHFLKHPDRGYRVAA